MFNYKDRENNKPFSINSWIFRPRQANITNRHYDMLHTQESEYAEIQGVMSRKLPGYQEKEVDSKYKDGYLLIFAPNYLAGCRLWYKLIYYKFVYLSSLDHILYNPSQVLSNQLF